MQVPVWAALNYTGFKVVQRELLLVKVSILGPEHVRAERNARSLDSQGTQEEAETITEENPLSPSEMIRQTQAHLKSLRELTHLFQGHVVDVSDDYAVIELSAKPDRIDAFIKLVRPFGIMEAARSGMMAMPRSPIFDGYEQNEPLDVQDKGSAVDASLLPPG